MAAVVDLAYWISAQKNGNPEDHERMVRTIRKRTLPAIIFA
jgi:hypothetical protein